MIKKQKIRANTSSQSILFCSVTNRLTTSIKPRKNQHCEDPNINTVPLQSPDKKETTLKAIIDWLTFPLLDDLESQLFDSPAQMKPCNCCIAQFAQFPQS